MTNLNPWQRKPQPPCPTICRLIGNSNIQCSSVTMNRKILRAGITSMTNELSKCFNETGNDSNAICMDWTAMNRFDH
ncbi:hypothetical protein OIU79_016639 [Salix purpurea]|uniref:Uncharacterized protein n=1 Tax=Salix purpurea TaxID=77065 RepID=A0A9Q0PF62_SALPP|nr:hypothetical protein OIU79_016639 [Salix purpurea]